MSEENSHAFNIAEEISKVYDTASSQAQNSVIRLIEIWFNDGTEAKNSGDFAEFVNKYFPDYKAPR